MNSNNHQNGNSGDEQASAAALAGLAREIDGLRRRLNPLDGLDERLADLATTVAALADEVATQGRRQTATLAVSWLDLPDGADDREPAGPAAAEQVLAELAGWVSRVYLRYADAAKNFPECWLWHPDVIEELCWLRHAWGAAYRSEGASPALAWDWHDRYRPGVVRRIHAAAGRCSLDVHLSDRGHPAGSAPVAPLDSALPAIAAWWANQRTDSPPEPTATQLDEAHALARKGGARR